MDLSQDCLSNCRVVRTGFEPHVGCDEHRIPESGIEYEGAHPDPFGSGGDRRHRGQWLPLGHHQVVGEGDGGEAERPVASDPLSPVLPPVGPRDE